MMARGRTPTPRRDPDGGALHRRGHRHRRPQQRPRPLLRRGHRRPDQPAQGGRRLRRGHQPEQLFAAGYAACFDNALASVARIDEVDPGPTSVTALVSLAKHPEDGFALDVELRVTVPNLPREQAEALVAKAHRRCPYSRATRGNLEVRLTVL